MEGITSLSAAVAEAQAHDDLLRIGREVAPYLEVAALARATDAGPVVLLERLRGQDGQRIVTDLFSDRRCIAHWCGVTPDELPRCLADVVLHPIASREVSRYPASIM